MSILSERNAWGIAAAGATILAAFAVREGLRAGWRGLRHEEPPTEDGATGGPLGGAVAWAAGSGLATGVAAVLATRGAAVAWERATGHRPHARSRWPWARRRATRQILPWQVRAVPLVLRHGALRRGASRWAWNKLPWS